MDVEPKVYSVPEIIKILRISRNSAYEAVRAGKIFGVRIGRRWLIPKAGIDKLLSGPEPDGVTAGTMPARGSRRRRLK